MRALALYGAEQMEVREIPDPVVRPHELLVRVDAVGLCGTDFHIYEGHANYRTDATGRPIPLSAMPLVLGHEMCGTVVEAGREVRDLKPGDRVLIDQGINCHSRGEPALCEYCATGNSHQCLRYQEHGITGPQGALAEYIAMPGVNAVRLEAPLPSDQAALAEPLACIIHACELTALAASRYQFGGANPIRAALIIGAGPAGLLFTQYLRQVIGFDGLLIVSEPHAQRRALAADYGAMVIDPSADELVAAVRDLTGGERVNLLIEAAGVAAVFRQMPGLLRKQATIVLYGHGHHGVDLGVLNNVQFLEPTFVAPIGASGGFDADRRPHTYRRALELVSDGTIDVVRIITHRYQTLEAVPQAFAHDHREPDYTKGVAILESS